MRPRFTPAWCIHLLLCVAALGSVFVTSMTACAESPIGVRPLRDIPSSEMWSLLPADTHILIEAAAIERFLTALDGTPPDWATVYGHGHEDAQHDERLFTLNRERDTKREGRDALHWRIAFIWSGELSSYDYEQGGFRVVLGPRFTSTSWGLVRFKYEDLFGNLIAIPTVSQLHALRDEISKQRSVEIDVVMLGTLIPEESIVYDFSHDEEGRGLIMPVVRIQDILYLHNPSRTAH